MRSLNKISFHYVLGLLLLISILFPNLSTTYVVKYDYILQHIPFYTEFIQLTKEGLPFWSWNSFLGTNFWGSKAYYLIGDPYAWFSIPLNNILNDLPKTLTLLLVIKFVISYSLFFWLTKYWNLRNPFRLVLSLGYAFSAWNLIFIEQPMFTSFYSFVPLLFIAYHRFETNNRLLFMVSFSVAILVSINFYLFWVISWLFLIYHIATYYRFNHHCTNIFIKQSLLLLMAFITGVLLSAVIWLPGVIHILQTDRLGEFLIEYSTWNSLQMSSFLTFTIIPPLKYLDGVLKDPWYYFNQIGIYVGSFSLLIIPHAWFVKNSKERVLSILLSILIAVLLVSPKIGLFFHFTYSLRYTFIHTFLLLYLMGISLKHFEAWKISHILIIGFLHTSLILFIIYYLIPIHHPSLPTHTEEIKLLYQTLVLSLLYTLSFVGIKYESFKNLGIIILISMMIFELSTFAQQAFKSQAGEGIIYYTDENFIKALDYIESIDPNFYRIYSNIQNELTNSGLAFSYLSNSTYDSTFQYTLSEFLTWNRQYPKTNWTFTLSDEAVKSLIGLKYLIIDESKEFTINDLYLSQQIGLDNNFGPYKIYQYPFETGLLKTYTKVQDISVLMKNNVEADDYYVSNINAVLMDTLFLEAELLNQYKPTNNKTSTQYYFNPSTFTNNYIEFNFDLNEAQFVMFNVPYDMGWSLTSNGRSIETFSVQGGFLGSYLEKGKHSLILKFVPAGFWLGSFLSILAATFSIFYMALNNERKL